MVTIVTFHVKTGLCLHHKAKREVRSSRFVVCPSDEMNCQCFPFRVDIPYLLWLHHLVGAQFASLCPLIAIDPVLIPSHHRPRRERPGKFERHETAHECR